MSLAHLPVASAGQDIRTARHLHLDHGVISSIIGFLDWFAISLGSLGSAFLFQLLFQNYFNDLDVALGVGIMAASFYVLLAAKLGLYQIPNLLDVRRALFKVCSVWASIVGLLILILFMLKVSASFSRGAVSLFAVLGLDVLLCGRLVIMVIARKLIANKVVTGRPAVIIGEASELSHWTASDFMIHFGVVETARVTLFSSDAATHLARLERAIELSQNNRAEEFLVAVRWAQSELLEKVQDCLRNSPLRVRLVPDVLMRTMMKRRSASLIPSIELQRAPLNSLERLVKRSFCRG
jgi:FlaA1/EpsC-like NDP-sugar epimerase